MARFSHPLARESQVWRLSALDGTDQQVLVIVTTLEVDPSHKRFKVDEVTRLSEEARAWLSDNSAEASGFMLINRVKDWNGYRPGGQTAA